MTDSHDVLTAGRDTGLAEASSQEAPRAPARTTIPTRRLNGLDRPEREIVMNTRSGGVGIIGVIVIVVVILFLVGVIKL